MKTVCIVVGARPNFVKVAPLVRAIVRSGVGRCRLVYAGSESDATLEPTLFDDLQMPRPDVFLGVESTRLNEITSQVMARFDAFLDGEAPTLPDVVVVVDDLASTMAAAIVAKKRGLRLAHLVAGTRSFDMTMPKEVNRLVIDALSDILFTAGTRSSSVAAREQGDSAATYMVGNILMDSLRFCRPRFRRPAVLPPVDAAESRGATPLAPIDGSYIVLTVNRRALLADTGKLHALLQAVATSAAGTPVVCPLRDAARRAFGLQSTAFTLLPPLPYLEFGWLTAHAKGIITDSGNVAEEATFNGVPCITLNSYTEHQETVTTGTNVLVGEDPQLLSEAVARMVAGQWKQGALPDRWDGRTAERIASILLA